MYMIESIHRELVHFQGLNSMAFFTFKNKYFSSCTRFGAHIVSTVILTSYERTHKDKTKCLKRILLTIKNPTPHLRTFWH